MHAVIHCGRLHCLAALTPFLATAATSNHGTSGVGKISRTTNPISLQLFGQNLYCTAFRDELACISFACPQLSQETSA